MKYVLACAVFDQCQIFVLFIPRREEQFTCEQSAVKKPYIVSNCEGVFVMIGPQRKHRAKTYIRLISNLYIFSKLYHLLFCILKPTIILPTGLKRRAPTGSHRIDRSDTRRPAVTRGLRNINDFYEEHTSNWRHR